MAWVARWSKTTTRLSGSARGLGKGHAESSGGVGGRGGGRTGGVRDLHLNLSHGIAGERRHDWAAVGVLGGGICTMDQHSHIS